MIATSNKVREIVHAAVEQLLGLYEPDEAENIIRLLLEERFGITRTQLALAPDSLLSESQIITLYKDLKKLKTGMPIQYQLGYTWFLGLRITVNPHVLIPRPETEELVMAVLRHLSNLPNPEVLEIGTGSGCIAIAVKHRKPDARIIASDIDSKVLEVANHNSLINNTIITFIRHDILTETIPGVNLFDCIISNPPYIPSHEAEEMPGNVIGYEPRKALFVNDNDPLLFVRNIAMKGKNRLKKGGCIIMEIHSPLADAVYALLSGLLYDPVEILEDIHGKKRIIKSMKPAV